MTRMHASCVALNGAGILFRGPSGSGKSDMCLRLIDGGAVLVADDQVLLTQTGTRLIATCPPSTCGLLEVRGIGIVRVPHVTTATVLLIVDLQSAGQVERLPHPRHCHLQGVEVPLISLAAFEESATAKVRLALGSLANDIAAFR